MRLTLLNKGCNDYSSYRAQAGINTNQDKFFETPV
jgi:hypothetical protein